MDITLQKLQPTCDCPLYIHSHFTRQNTRNETLEKLELYGRKLPIAQSAIVCCDRYMTSDCGDKWRVVKTSIEIKRESKRAALQKKMYTQSNILWNVMRLNSCGGPKSEPTANIWWKKCESPKLPARHRRKMSRKWTSDGERIFYNHNISPYSTFYWWTWRAHENQRESATAEKNADVSRKKNPRQINNSSRTINLSRG